MFFGRNARHSASAVASGAPTATSGAGAPRRETRGQSVCGLSASGSSQSIGHSDVSVSVGAGASNASEPARRQQQIMSVNKDQYELQYEQLACPAPASQAAPQAPQAAPAQQAGEQRKQPEMVEQLNSAGEQQQLAGSGSGSSQFGTNAQAASRFKARDLSYADDGIR